jgi:nicotinamide mononucleotide (NMN) deamidase PncC
MPNLHLPLVQRIHGSGTGLVLAATGGGSRALAELLTVPGASRSILEAVVPYAASALANWLGSAPEHFCDARTARAMAMAAYERAQRLAPGAERVAGIGCTASLASDRPKRGPHRAHLAWQTGQQTVSMSLELAKNQRTRDEEETLVAGLVLQAVAEACGLGETPALPLLPLEKLVRASCLAPPAWQDLLAGRASRVLVGREPGPAAAAIFPGAFNPLHAGHRRIAQLGEQLLGLPVAYELSLANVDKPPLDFVEVSRRVAQFAAEETLWLTRAATFLEKAALFPGATFLVGADTIVRIGEPRYYRGDEAACRRAWATMAASGCRFLVFGRELEGRFCTLDELGLPAELAALCQCVPGELFRQEVSSTALRRAAEGRTGG